MSRLEGRVEKLEQQFNPGQIVFVGENDADVEAQLALHRRNYPNDTREVFLIVTGLEN